MRRYRDFLSAALLTIAIGLSGDPSFAQESFPSRVVKVIVPFPPGSTLDALTRVMTDQLAQKWGQPVVIENVSGGGGNIGTERFARSAPDGYTLLFAPPGPFTVNPLLYADVNFDPAKFAAISLMAKVPNVLLTKNNIGANTTPELIALAKANPGKLTYATQGVGSTAFLTAKLFEARAGIEMVHVPYRGAGPALSDIVAGHVDMMFDTIVTSLPLHRGGKAKILAIANDERSRALPEPADHRRIGIARFPLGVLVCGRGAARHAWIDHRKNQPGHRRTDPPARGRCQAPRIAARSAGQHAGGSRQVLRRRNGAVEQGDQGRQCEAAIDGNALVPTPASAPGSRSTP